MPAVANRTEHDVVVCDESAAAILKGRATFRLVKNWHTARPRKLRNVFVLCSAMGLPAVADFVTSVNREHRLRAIFVRQDADPAWLPQLLERANLRTIRNMIVHDDQSVPVRVLSAWEHGAQEELIAQATVADKKVLLMSCAFERFEVDFDSLPALKKIPVAERGKFAVSDDGSYIHWPGPDIHLDLDAIKAAIDPSWRAHVAAARLSHNTRYGRAIENVRKRHGLRQSDIAELSERQVRRIESGGPVSVAALRALAAAHNLTLDEYLSNVAEAASEA